jgi:chromosomal replication initiation ATPase DnaA
MPCSKYQELRARFELAQTRFTRFRDEKKRDLRGLHIQRAANIQREERANMALLTQRILDHRVSCPICENEARDSEISIEAIQTAVAELFGLSVEELKRRDSKRVLTLPREAGIYLAKLFTDESLPDIGRQFGGSHHTTVRHSLAKVDEQRRTDPKLASTITSLLGVLFSRNS